MKDRLYSEYFNITPTQLKKFDVFNGFMNRDAQFYILPHKLDGIAIKEFVGSYDKYRRFFANIIKILDASSVDDVFYRQAQKKFEFHEFSHIGLGFSKNSKRGSGIGKKSAEQLTKTAFELIKAGIKDPEVFELVGLLEKKIGPDRISDMTISILADDFLTYTQNIANSLKIPVKIFLYNGIGYRVPHSPYNEPILFCPKQILTALPVAFDYGDIGDVCSHNEALRCRVNEIIADTFDKTTKALIKQQFKKLLLANPELLKSAIGLYKDKSSVYDFDNDPKGEFIWKEVAQEATSNYPLVLTKASKPIDVVTTICNKFKDLIENNGLWKFFHNSNGGHKNESFAQMLFFAIAHSYCEANNLDISPESNSGGGPVDFKIGSGFNDKINIEMKLSSNKKLLDGFKKQLKVYNEAEKTNQSFFVIIQLYEEHGKKIKTVFEYKNLNETIDNKLPNIILVDTTIKKSASKQ